MCQHLTTSNHFNIFFFYFQTKDRIVAIKTVQRNSLSSSSKENLLVEIKLLKRLNHKYIVNMFDFIWDEQ